MEIKQLHFLVNMSLVTCLLWQCNLPFSGEQDFSPEIYLNHHDSVKYLGTATCIECHYEIYQSYLQTGMGRSFGPAHPNRSAAVIGEDSIVHDPHRNLYYKPFWSGDTLKVREFRLSNGRVVYERIETVHYIVGSGNHTNSHIYMSGNYAYQVPFTYYTQSGRFDLPPGYEDGANSRFSRRIGLECMSCHNALPEFVLGSENKYVTVPSGIDCERCHGPGEIHVSRKRQGIQVDTSKYIDYTIVNPRRLSEKLQTDLCARCHLQGTMVLKPGKNFFDFRPGMHLSDVLDVFMPLYEGGREDFIMASQYERMTQSQCYINSDQGLRCVSCHNPHISTKNTPVEQYMKVCLSCHTSPKKECSEQTVSRQFYDDNCVVCHMPRSGSRDIPHVSVHDHKISIQKLDAGKSRDRIFKGLIALNNPQPDPLTKARGYLLEYESFEPNPLYLDSAWYYLSSNLDTGNKYHFHALINYHFLKNDHKMITDVVLAKGIQVIIDSVLNHTTYDNMDAWSSYRVGQAFENSGNNLIAEPFYRNAAVLAKYNLDFQNKYGSLLVVREKYAEAKKVYEFILAEDPHYAPGWVNLGYLLMKMNRIPQAEQMMQHALRLDPDNVQGLINMASICIMTGRKQEAHRLTSRVLELIPGHKEAMLLKSRL
jgi:predicted CXXCH cytochrome family protein